MAGLNKLDYTPRDFDSIMEALITYVQNRLPDWTDYNESSVGRMVLELVAWVGDLLNFYLDKQSNEAFLPTAIRRSNIINLCKMLGYELSSASAATTILRFTLDAANANPVIIPKATKVKTTGDYPIYFEVNEITTIPAGERTVELVATEGYTATDIMAISDGEPGQQRTGRYNPFIEDTLLVYADGVQWSEVDNFLDSTAADMHYIANVDDKDYIGIEFGDGVNGAIPIAGVDIRAIYRVGGGVRGRVEQNTLTELIDTIYAYAGEVVTAVTASVTNTVAATGGTDRETIEHARMAAPKQVRVADRSIAKEDFEINAEDVVGVCRVLALSSNESTTVPENTVRVFVVPDGGGVPTDALLAEVETALTETKPMWVTGILEVWAAFYEEIDITVDVYYRATYDATTIQALVEAAITTFFTPGEIDTDEEYYINFGRAVFLSDLYRYLDSLTGIDHVDITLPTGNTTLDAWRYPAEGTVIVNAYAAS